jgi:hypothetical protein
LFLFTLFDVRNAVRAEPFVGGNGFQRHTVDVISVLTAVAQYHVGRIVSGDAYLADHVVSPIATGQPLCLDIISVSVLELYSVYLF